MRAITAFLIGLTLGLSPTIGWGVLPLVLFIVAVHLFVLMCHGPTQQPQKHQHPAMMRFCPVCGADDWKRESCDAGLHS